MNKEERFEYRRQCLLRVRDEYCEGKTSVLSKKTGIDQNYLGRLFYEPGKKGKKNIGEDTIEKINLVFPGWLNESNVEPGPDVIMSKPLRISGEIQGGDSGYLDIQQFPEGYAEGCVMNPVRGSNCYALRVRGDSMHPRIRHKEIIIINPDPEPKEGDEVVVNLKDGRQMVKIFLFEREGEVSLGSINDGYPISVIDLTSQTVDVIQSTIRVL